MVYLRLLRWPNVLMVGLILVLALTQVVQPISELSGVASCASLTEWLLMVAATMLIAASGNVINDIFDQDIDRHNRPQKMIVGKHVNESRAWNLYYILVTLGVGAGIYLCWQLDTTSSALLFLLSAGGLYFYSYSYKRQFLIGNLTVSLLAGLVPFMPLYLEMLCNDRWREVPWAPMLTAYAFFAFLTTFIREVIKDMEDVKGDSLQRCRTVPIVLGTKGAKLLVSSLLLMLVASVGWLQQAWWLQNDMLSLLYFLLIVQIPAAAVGILLWRATSAEGYHRASTLTKGLMLGGILYMFVYSTLLR